MKIKRFWEIDALRGIAIIMMVFYHVLWALDVSGIINFPQVRYGFWRGFAVVTATTFIFLVGVSLTISYSRIKNKKINYFKKYLRRGIKIFGYGLLITAFSFLVFKEQFVYFGVLHFIGVGIILAIPFLNMKDKNLLFGLIAVGIGLILRNIWLDFPWLVILGLKFRGINTIDYFPVFPWLGVILIGLFVGNRLYQNGKRRFAIPEKFPLKEVLSFLGRHSLMIYFIHAIVIFSIIFIIIHI
jgi:uncharacterized membrane protein